MSSYSFGFMMTPSSSKDSDADSFYLPPKYKYAQPFPPTVDYFLALTQAKVGIWREALLEREQNDTTLKMLNPSKKMGTTIAVQFQQGSWMYEALNDLHRRLHSALGDYYYPQQNAHFTIGAGNLDPTSELEFNFYNSNETLVKDLQRKVSALASKIREGTVGTTLPQQWRNFFLKVVEGDHESNGPLVSQTDAVRRAVSLFGAPGMPAIPTVEFAPVEQNEDSLVFSLEVKADAREDVVIDTKTWGEIWKHHIPDMAMKWKVDDFEQKFQELESKENGATIKEFQTYAKMEVDSKKSPKKRFEQHVVRRAGMVHHIESDGSVISESVRKGEDSASTVRRRTVKGYRLTSIQMYRLALLCLGQQIKQFKAGSHMNLGFLGPKDGQDKKQFSAEIDDKKDMMRDGVEKVLGAHREDWRKWVFESGAKVEYLTGKTGKRLHELNNSDSGATMAALFYFENSLHSAQSVNLLAEPEKEFFCAWPTSVRPASDDDRTIKQGMPTPDLRAVRKWKRFQTRDEGRSCRLKLSAETIFRKDLRNPVTEEREVHPTYDLEMSDAWKQLRDEVKKRTGVDYSEKYVGDKVADLGEAAASKRMSRGGAGAGGSQA